MRDTYIRDNSKMRDPRDNKIDPRDPDLCDPRDNITIDQPGDVMFRDQP